LPSTGKTISVYYKNNTGITNGQNVSGVWDANYVGVWHMQQVNATDSTSNGNNGTASANGGVTLNSSGMIDGADTFNGTEYISVPDSTNLNLGVNNFTIELWLPVPWGPGRYIFDESMTTDWAAMIRKGWMTNAPPKTWGVVQNADTYNDIAYQDLNDTPNGGFNVWIDIPNMANGWHYVVITRSGRNHSMYLDGRFNTSKDATIANLTNITYALAIGQGQDYFNGTLDEIRISNTNRSINWINQTYQLIANQANFVSFGTEQNR
jgi:hypothetical protein